MTKRVVFVLPPSRYRISSVDKNSPPMSLAYLANKLPPEYDVKIIDGRRLGMHQLVADLRKLQPDITGISVWCTNHNFGMMLTKVLKGKILIGGPNVAARRMAAKVLINHPKVTAVVRGPAELTIRTIIDRLNKEQPLDGIPGVSYRSGETITHISQATPPDNLDFRAGLSIRKYFPVSLYDFTPQRYEYGFLPQVPSAFFDGCMKASVLGKCSFCSVGMPSKPHSMTPRLVAKELTRWRDEDGVKFILESGSSLDREWVKELARYGKDYAPIRIRTYAQPDGVDNDFARDLKQCGAWACVLGLESASQEILQQIGKPLDLDRVKESIQALTNQGVKVVLNFIFGLPGETLDTMKATRDLSYKLFEQYPSVVRIFYNVFNLEPNSRLFNQATQNPIFINNYNRATRGNLEYDDMLDYACLDSLYFQHYTHTSRDAAIALYTDAKRINDIRPLL